MRTNIDGTQPPEELKDSDADARRTYLVSLRDGAFPPAAIDRIIFHALGDDDFSVRREAIVLAEAFTDDVAARAAVVAALCDETSLSRRSAAMEAVGRAGAEILPSLKPLLEDVREGVRRLVIDSVGRIEHPSTFEFLEIATHDPSPAVRAATAEALGRTEKGRAEPLLRMLLETDAAVSVKLAALLSAESLDLHLDANLLVSLTRTGLTAPSALRELGRIGEPRPLVRALLAHETARQRAALVGLTQAFDVNDIGTIAAIHSVPSEQLLAPCRIWIERRDPSVASGALLVGSALGEIEMLALAVTRNDRAELHAGLMRAALCLRHEDPAYALEKLAQEIGDEGAAELLREARDFYVERSTPPEERTTTPPRMATPSGPDAFENEGPTQTSISAPAFSGGRLMSSAEAQDRLTPQSFARLAASMERFAGLTFDEHSAYRLEARLMPRLRAVGAHSFEEYARLLENNSRDAKSETQEAVSRLTVHETYFYREQPQLRAFATELLPVLWRTRHQMRVWSAGCSTGEEAWTIAMLLEEFRLAHPNFRWEVHGTDLVEAVVKEARAGEYGKRSFRGELPKHLKKKYVEPLKDDRGRIRETLRDRVRFDLDNLVEGEVRERAYDVIFCRNVLIYLSKEARSQVIERFYRSLRPGGVLLLGHSESLFSLETRFRLLPLSRELAYARPPIPDVPSTWKRKKGGR